MGYPRENNFPIPVPDPLRIPCRKVYQMATGMFLGGAEVLRNSAIFDRILRDKQDQHQQLSMGQILAGLAYLVDPETVKKFLCDPANELTDLTATAELAWLECRNRFFAARYDGISVVHHLLMLLEKALPAGYIPPQPNKPRADLLHQLNSVFRIHDASERAMRAISLMPTCHL
jgi:hypothetical protein